MICDRDSIKRICAFRCWAWKTKSKKRSCRGFEIQTGMRCALRHSASAGAGKEGCRVSYSPLDLVENYLGRFVAYPSEHALTAHVLWIAHAHMIECFDTTPRLAFMSAEKESGKTRALEVTALLVPDPILSISASPAVIVRLVSAGKRNEYFYDEIDAVFGNAKAQYANADLCAILNGGYRRGASVYRCTTNGRKVEPEALNAFAPVAVAGLRDLPDTLASRSIFVRMKRRSPDEYRGRSRAVIVLAVLTALAIRPLLLSLDLDRGFSTTAAKGTAP